MKTENKKFFILIGLAVIIVLVVFTFLNKTPLETDTKTMPSIQSVNLYYHKFTIDELDDKFKDDFSDYNIYLFVTSVEATNNELRSQLQYDLPDLYTQGENIQLSNEDEVFLSRYSSEKIEIKSNKEYSYFLFKSNNIYTLKIPEDITIKYGNDVFTRKVDMIMEL